MGRHETIHEHLKVLGKQSGKQFLALDDEGVCSIDIDDMNVVINAVDRSPWMTLYAELQPLPSDAKERLARLEDAMLLNFLGIALGGAVLSCHPQRASIGVHYCHLTDQVTSATVLANIIENFVSSVLEAKQRLSVENDSGAGFETIGGMRV